MLENPTNITFHTYKNGALYQADIPLGTASACSAGRLGSDEFVCAMSFTLPKNACSASFALRAGAQQNTASDAPLRYKLLPAADTSYAAADSGFSGDGSFFFGGAEGVATFSIVRSLAAGAYTLYIFNGGGTYYGNYTQLRTNYESGAAFEPVPQLTYALDSDGGTSPGSTSVMAEIGGAIPAIVPPRREYAVTINGGFAGATETSLSVAHVFGGYYHGDTRYIDENGNALRPADLPHWTILKARWSGGNISMPPLTRAGCELLGFFSAPDGGEEIRDGDVITGNATIYARWRLCRRYLWDFVEVKAVANSEDRVVRGIWSGFVAGREVLCAACNGYLWELLLENGLMSKRACGELRTDSDVFMFGFSGKLFLQNGSEYKVWDGASLLPVSGYRPLVLRGCSPAGGGSLLEGVNMLTGKKRALYSPDGVSAVFQLPETQLVSIDYVKNAATGADMEGCTFDSAAARVSFSSAPPTGTDSIEIGWCSAHNRADEVLAMRFAELYNGTQDSRIFIYGDGTNRLFYSGIDTGGQPRADYFPDLCTVHIGDANTPVTAALRHRSRLLVFKTDSAWSVSSGSIDLADGRTEAGFFVVPMHRDIGCCAPGQAVLCDGSPRTPDGRSIIEWRADYSGGASGSDERAAERISQRVAETIRRFDLRTSKCFFDKLSGEYYIIGAEGTALIHSLDADAWYVYRGFDAVCLINYRDELYFGRRDGTICRFSKDCPTDNGVPIRSVWESGALDMGANYRRKSSAMLWIGIKPEPGASITVRAIGDGKNSPSPLTFSYGGEGAEIKRLRMRTRGFTRYKLRFENEASGPLTVISADIRFRENGLAR